MYNFISWIPASEAVIERFYKMNFPTIWINKMDLFSNCLIGICFFENLNYSTQFFLHLYWRNNCKIFLKLSNRSSKYWNTPLPSNHTHFFLYSGMTTDQVLGLFSAPSLKNNTKTKKIFLYLPAHLKQFYYFPPPCHSFVNSLHTFHKKHKHGKVSYTHSK